MSQVAFAAWLSARLGWRITQTELSKWETGRRLLSNGNLHAFAAATAGEITPRSYRAWARTVRTDANREVA